MSGCNRPIADSLNGTGLVSLRLESLYETRADSISMRIISSGSIEGRPIGL